MLTVLGVSLIFSIGFIVNDVRKSRRQLHGLDPTMVLAAADDLIDRPLAAALAAGSVRLIRCDWFADHDPPTDGSRLAEEAFLPPAEAVDLLRRGDRSILVLSVRWETLLAPDPEGVTVGLVRRYLDEDPRRRLQCALFWDVYSLPPPSGIRRHHAADLQLSSSVVCMLFASITGTSVLQVKNAPKPRPSRMDGSILIFNPHVLEKEEPREASAAVGVRRGRSAASAAASGTREMRLRAKLEQRYGKVVSCLSRTPRVSASQPRRRGEGGRGQALEAGFVWNASAYDECGRSVAEQGMAMTVVAHIAAADRGNLPARFMHAAARRAKLIDLSGGSARNVHVKEPPRTVRRATLAALGAAYYADRRERVQVASMFAQLEFTVDAALDEGSQMQQLDTFTINPRLLEQLKMISSVQVPIHFVDGLVLARCTRSQVGRAGHHRGRGGLAHRRGLHVGAVIIAVNGEEAGSARSAAPWTEP